VLLKEDAAMTNHHAGPTTTEDIYGIFPALVHISIDDINEEQDHPKAAWQKADTAERHFLYRNISGHQFERRVGLDGAIERTVSNTMPWAAETAGHKIFLPRRSGEQRFGPQQYYYAASKGGVIPS
jgi:hypothetical protein